MLVDALAAAGFYLIPYLTGRLFVCRWLQAWAVGSLVWLVVFQLAAWLPAAPPALFSWGLGALAVGVCVLSTIRVAVAAHSMPDAWSSRLRSRPLWLVMTFSALACGVYLFIWANKTPYPLETNWDAFEHIALAGKVAQGHMSFLPSDISDAFTFDGYSTLFHVLLALSSVTFHRAPLGIYWWLNLSQYLLSVAGSVALARMLSGSTATAVVAGVLGLFVFASFVAYQPLFFIPQTFAALVGLLGVIEVTRNRAVKLRHLWPVVLVIGLLHFIVGLAAAMVVLVFALLPYERFRRVLGSRAVACLALLALAVGIALHGIGGWQLTSREEASHFILSLTTTAQLLFQWYGLAALVLFSAGCWALMRSNACSDHLTLTVAISTLAVALAPFSYVLKLFAVGYYFVNLVAAQGAGVLIHRFSALGKAAAVGWLGLVFLLVFYRNQTYFKEPLYFRGAESNVSRAEIEAGQWLRAQSLVGDLLVSDPATQHIMEAVGGANTQGGAYMSLATRRALEGVAGASNPNMVAQTLLDIHDQLGWESGAQTGALFVLSGRYFEWQALPLDQRDSVYYNVWQPVALTQSDSAYIDRLESSDRFKLLYENDELAILAVH